MEVESTNSSNLQNLLLRSKKRSLDLFLDSNSSKISEDDSSLKIKLALKINSEYSQVKDLPAPPKPERSISSSQTPKSISVGSTSIETPKKEEILNTTPSKSSGIVTTIEEEEEEEENVEVLEAVDEGHFKLIDSIPSNKKKKKYKIIGV